MLGRNMFPHLVLHYLAHGATGYAVSTRQGCLRPLAATPKLTRFLHQGVSQFGFSYLCTSRYPLRMQTAAMPITSRQPLRVQPWAAPVTYRHAVSLNHVTDVVIASPGVEMVRPNTRPIVAMMQYPQAVRNRPIRQGPTQPMCQGFVTMHHHAAITQAAVTAPLPARRRFVDKMPESSAYRLRRSARFGRVYCLGRHHTHEQLPHLRVAMATYGTRLPVYRHKRLPRADVMPSYYTVPSIWRSF